MLLGVLSIRRAPGKTKNLGIDHDHHGNLVWPTVQWKAENQYRRISNIFQVKSYRDSSVTQHTRASDRIASASGRRQTLGLCAQ